MGDNNDEIFFLSCLSSRHPFIVHRLTRTCTIDTLHTSTRTYAYAVQILVEIISILFVWPTVLMDISRSIMPIELFKPLLHFYKVTKYSFNLVFHVRPSYVLKRTKLNRLPLPIQAFEYIHYYTSLLIKMKTEAQIVCSHTETNEELLEWWRHCRRTIRHRRSNVSNCEWWCAGTQLSIV
jgi:hypothetical protein